MTELSDPRNTARLKLVEAIRDYADAHEKEWPADAIVTGYFVAVELTHGRGVGTMWITGNGNVPTDNDWEGLAPHRVEGLVLTTLRSALEWLNQEEE